MASKSKENCSMCAYAMKNGAQIWCPFHDLQVSPKVVCDDFLDEFQSPKWIALAAGMNDNERSTPQYLPRDIGVYVTTYIIWFLAAVLIAFGFCVTV